MHIHSVMSISSEPEGEQSGSASGKVGDLRGTAREGVRQKCQTDIWRQKHPLRFYKQCPWCLILACSDENVIFCVWITLQLLKVYGKIF